jgi:7-carboxy-7-deazaguanine synthase
LERLAALPIGPQLVVLSGGNPALLQLGELVDELQIVGRQVAVETQGSLWREWLGRVDRLVVSPKPPSSGMVGPEHAAQTARFMEKLAASGVDAALKIVVFDDDDLNWAQEFASAYPDLPLYVSAGTDVGVSDAQTIAIVRRRFAWLAEAVAARPGMAQARVLPQLHVIAWGTAKGV